MSTKTTLALFSCLLFVSLAVQASAAGSKPEENPFAGRLVKTATSSAVYYIGPDSKRHAFPNDKIYFSWYSNFNTVEVIDDFEMALYPLGSNVLYKAGSRLVKISDVPEVYAVEPGGVLRNIPSEEIAHDLYGANWSKQVDDLDISFFFDYDIGGVIDVVDEKPLYPRGTVIDIDGSHYVADKSSTGAFWLRPITKQAWEQNGFGLLNVRYLDPSWRELYIIGLPILAPESVYACPACGVTKSADITFVSRQSVSGRYTFSAPESWGVSFFPVEVDRVTDLMLMTESIDETAARASVVRWPREAGQELSDFVPSRINDFTSDNSRVYSAVASRDRLGAYDLVGIVADNETERTLVWSRYIATTDAWYELTFRTPFTAFSGYRDVAQQLFSTFSVHEAVPE